MTKQTILSEAKVEVLDALEEHLGAKEVRVASISDYYDYGFHIERTLHNLLTGYAEYKYFHSTERAELERQQRLAREEELRERSKVIRDNIMIGVLSNMTMKLRKYFPDSAIEFNLGSASSCVSVSRTMDPDDEMMFIEYYKNDSLQKYELTVHIDGVGLWEDDVTVVNGNQRPADQFTGIAGLDAYLDTLPKKEN